MFAECALDSMSHWINKSSGRGTKPDAMATKEELATFEGCDSFIAKHCWNKRITAIPTSAWREMSGQEQQERMHVAERQW